MKKRDLYIARILLYSTLTFTLSLAGLFFFSHVRFLKTLSLIGMAVGGAVNILGLLLLSVFSGKKFDHTIKSALDK